MIRIRTQFIIQFLTEILFFSVDSVTSPLMVPEAESDSSNDSSIFGQSQMMETNAPPGQLGISPSPNKLKSIKKKPQYVINKELRQSGQAYFTSKGKYINAKKFHMFYCNVKCPHKCTQNLIEINREAIFTHFWDLKDLQSQNNFLANTVVVTNTQRVTVANSRKKNSRKYFLGDVQVCKAVFLNTLNISNKRINYCLNIKQKEKMCSPDRRGRTTANKVSEERINNIKEFLNSIPRYKSHYTSSDKSYFSPDLTKKILFDLYKEKYPRDHVRQEYFYTEFRKYEIGIYIPKTDTCQQCDSLKIKIASAEDSTELEDERRRHHNQAEVARGILTAARGMGKRSQGTLAFSFDMQKTQPLPRLNTSVVFYKRQLWIYNLGINDLSNNQGTMCIWTENEGRRGSSEIISSIFAFLKSQQLENISKIETFSDACGGQNRNKAIISFFNWFCQKHQIEEWTHTYMESGHSYLPNDRDFGMIEKRTKSAISVFSKEDWFGIVKNSQIRKPFHIIDMKGKFLDCEKFNKLRKFDNSATNDSVKFNFLKLKAFTVKKDSHAVVYRRTGDELQVPNHRLDYPPIETLEEISYLPDIPICISAEKFKDLQDLLPYIPPNHHHFYKSLDHN